MLASASDAAISPPPTEMEPTCRLVSLSCDHPPPSVTELPSTPKIKQQSSITNPHSETGHFHIKSMPKCGKFGAASTAGWGAGAAIFSPVGRVVLLQKGGSPPQTPPTFRKDSSPRIPDAIGSLHLGAPTEFRHCLSRS